MLVGGLLAACGVRRQKFRARLLLPLTGNLWLLFSMQTQPLVLIFQIVAQVAEHPVPFILVKLL